MPFFVIFRFVREKLLVTVSLDRPVHIKSLASSWMGCFYVIFRSHVPCQTCQTCLLAFVFLSFNYLGCRQSPSAVGSRIGGGQGPWRLRRRYWATTQSCRETVFFSSRKALFLAEIYALISLVQLWWSAGFSFCSPEANCRLSCEN